MHNSIVISHIFFLFVAFFGSRFFPSSIFMLCWFFVSAMYEGFLFRIPVSFLYVCLKVTAQNKIEAQQWETEHRSIVSEEKKTAKKVSNAKQKSIFRLFQYFFSFYVRSTFFFWLFISDSIYFIVHTYYYNLQIVLSWIFRSKDIIYVFIIKCEAKKQKKSVFGKCASRAESSECWRKKEANKQTWKTTNIWNILSPADYLPFSALHFCFFFSFRFFVRKNIFSSVFSHIAYLIIYKCDMAFQAAAVADAVKWAKLHNILHTTNSHNAFVSLRFTFFPV